LNQRSRKPHYRDQTEAVADGMARPREFDRSDVLEKAMQVFWTKGYERTSVRELVAAMGINRGSLYDTFGDKQALYLTALERYCTSEARPMPAASGGESPSIAIRRHFETVAKAGPRARKRGCFISNTITEFSSQGCAISQTARAGVARIETALMRLVAQAQTAGEIRRDRDPRALARFLTSSLNGLRLMAKADVTRAELEDIVEVTLSTLK
jgi:TetR/AcrR family transcriptional regulator, transcriptional repressor for nem operon